MGHALEAVQVPAGDLGDDVVQAGLKAGGGLLWYGVLYLRQGDAQSQLSGNERQGIPVTDLKAEQVEWSRTIYSYRVQHVLKRQIQASAG